MVNTTISSVIALFDMCHVNHSLSLNCPEKFTSMYFSPQRVMQTASDPCQARRMLAARNANSVVKWRELCSINDAFVSFAQLGLKIVHKSSNMRTY